MRKEILLGKVPVEYDLQIKNVKRINLRVHRDGRVHVSVNQFVSQRQIDAFLRQNADFILENLEKFARMRQAGDGMTVGNQRQYEDGDILYLKGKAYRLRVTAGKKDSIERIDRVLLLTQKDPQDAERRKRMMEKYLTVQCRETIESLCHQVYPAFEKMGVVWPEIRIRSMVSRWGSCHPAKGILTFARQLIEVPEKCIEYVVVHEFSHFIHPDHSPRFHDFLTAMMPDWKERRNLLNGRYWIE